MMKPFLYILYFQLQNEEEEATSSTPATLSVEATNQEASSSSSSVPPDQPPPYIADGESTPAVEFSNEPPPQYTDVVKLPTYNESENVHDPNHEETEHSNDHRSVSELSPNFKFQIFISLISQKLQE